MGNNLISLVKLKNYLVYNISVKYNITIKVDSTLILIKTKMTVKNNEGMNREIIPACY